MTALFSSEQQAKTQHIYSTYLGDIKIYMFGMEAWKAFILRTWYISGSFSFDTGRQKKYKAVKFK